MIPTQNNETFLRTRLFLFTNYAWSTWADILGCDFDTYENWAYPGLGNRAIAERVAELTCIRNIDNLRRYSNNTMDKSSKT